MSLVYLPADNLPPVALPDDRVVEIQGEPNGTHKAVELIATHLRKYLVDRSVLPLFEKRLSLSNVHMEQNMPAAQTWSQPQGLPPNSGGLGYGGNPQFIPPRPHHNFYPPPERPLLEKQPHHGISLYGQNTSPMGIHMATNQHAPTMISQVTQHMQISLSYADAVIGEAGSNISYIRRSSGATITIQESRGVPGEMTVEITGSATQVQTAQQLIQNFMAAAAAPQQSTVSSSDHGYSSYQAHGPMYGSPANAGGPYGSSTYGSNYGY
ncbi:hypothetical protein BHM03_00031569 [Ensete ventricosum]|nr:hypothetical protein BHM03_00031569 [Ensete ventricosum]